MENRHLRAGPRSNVCELERNIASTNKDNSGRQFLQVEEVVAGPDMFLSGDASLARCRTGRENDVGRPNDLITYLNRIISHEACMASKNVDSCLPETFHGALPECRPGTHS